MSLIRKVFWPAAIAMAFLAVLAATSSADQGSYTPNNNYSYGRYQDGAFCAVFGPKTMAVGQTSLFAARLDHWSSHDTTVSLDNIVGSSKITSVVDRNDDYTLIPDTNLISGVRNFNTLAVGDSHNYNTSYDSVQIDSMHSGYHKISLDQDVKDLLAAKYGQTTVDALLALNVGSSQFNGVQGCGLSTVNALVRIIEDGIVNGNTCSVAASSFNTFCSPQGGTTANNNIGNTGLFHDWDIDCPYSTCTISGAAITAAATAIANDLANPYQYSGFYGSNTIDCYDIAIDAQKAIIGQGVTDSVVPQFADFIEQVCNAGFELGDRSGFNHDGFIDSLVIVDVTCRQAGNFDLSFSDNRDVTDAVSIHVDCRGVPTTQSKITASHLSVEIVPAVGNVSKSLITVTVVDSTGSQAGAGYEVDFSTDKCAIESSAVQTATTYDGAGGTNGVFKSYNSSVPSTAAAIESSVYATTMPDSTPGVDTTRTFQSTVAANSTAPVQDPSQGFAGTTTTMAAAVLGCSPDWAQGATPGVATVTAIISVASNALGIISASGTSDVVLTQKVTVVGPPYTVTVSASPTTVRCGEKATIVVTAKDAIGQNVSDHTRVEAVTNAGGVLGGTGAVANASGPSVPNASTVAETFAGQATLYLLTSESHTGPYEVVVTTGGSGSLGSALGGVFSTQPQVAQVTVTCTVPQAVAPAAPAAPAPVAAAPVTPPRTGQGPSFSAPNTGDAGLAASNSSSLTLFAIVGLAAFAIAGLATVRFARRSN